MLKSKLVILEEFFSSKKDKELKVSQNDNAEDENKEAEAASCTNEGAEMADEQVEKECTVSSDIITLIDNDAITKSETDKRQYRGLELANHLKVLLVSDPDASTAAAAIDVHVGELKDPREIPGLAHFCEHMLFRGTQKYPDEGEYLKFLSEHGGQGNACTSEEHTQFYFSVAPEFLPDMLDRFVQFFLSPLFTQSDTEREINAVDSENDKNLKVDARRMYALRRRLAKPEHDYSKFDTGSKFSLETMPKEAGLDVCKELLSFYQSNYSSNIMTLVVLGRESLEDLASLVVPLFVKIEDKQLAVQVWNEHPYGPQQLKTWVYMVPVKTRHMIHLNWPIPDWRGHYKTKPSDFVSFLLGHQGPGGLLAELKSKGWATEVEAGTETGAKGFAFYHLQMTLTELGADHVEEIITLAYQYLKLIRKSGISETIFRELQELRMLAFKFLDKSESDEFVSALVTNLHDYPMNDVISGPCLIPEFKPELIQALLDKLIPENMIVFVLDKKYEGKTDQTESWYGTEYKTEKISDNILKKWKKCSTNDKFHLPKPNSFIPGNVAIVDRESSDTDKPYMIRDSALSRLWFAQDNTFLIPKARVSMEIRSPAAYCDPISANLTTLFAAMARERLTEYETDTQIAGLSYDIHPTNYGLQILIHGYNDKQLVLLRSITDKITNLKPDPKKFDVEKQEYTRHLKNFAAAQPYKHGLYYTRSSLSEVMWTPEELLETLDDITIEQLEVFVKRFLARVFIESLIYGNVTKKVALKMQDYVERSLQNRCGSKPMLPSQHRQFRQVQLPDGCSFVLEKDNNVHSCCCVDVVFQTGLSEPRENALLKLLQLSISDPVFSVLRTDQQLGYIVDSDIWSSCGVKGLRIIVQSDKTPDYVTKHIDAFLHSAEKTLRSMHDKAFKELVESMSSKLKEKPQDMAAQCDKYWTEITDREYIFERDKIELECLNTLTKSELYTFLKERVAADGPKRRRFCTHIRPTEASKCRDSNQSADAHNNVDSNVEEEESDPEVTQGKMSEKSTLLKDEPDKNRKDTIGDILKTGRDIVRSKSMFLKTKPKHVDKTVVVDDVFAFKRELGLYPCPKPNISSSDPVEEQPAGTDNT
ncbi:insulin-degrading enzyme-like [Gigantopelta aegis]|uniref:insulin-degrading enzyme-like n=1 Tax=Gigantopelta aegis TaxID=1735272 RepID=UPI001B888B03|nr:insulin-degrading enzyme-like [Gigantopelta aegis]